MQSITFITYFIFSDDTRTTACADNSFRIFQRSTHLMYHQLILLRFWQIFTHLMGKQTQHSAGTHTHNEHPRNSLWQMNKCSVLTSNQSRMTERQANSFIAIRRTNETYALEETNALIIQFDVKDMEHTLATRALS